jgi:hypothetical protein
MAIAATTAVTASASIASATSAAVTASSAATFAAFTRGTTGGTATSRSAVFACGTVIIASRGAIVIPPRGAVIIASRGALLGPTGHFVDVFGMIVVEVRHIEEGVAFQSKVHECGLHAWQDACHAAFVDTASE